MVGELNALLSKAGEVGPFVLVGHSLGGMNARLFAAEFPGETAGMVLVDSSHEDMESRLTRKTMLKVSGDYSSYSFWLPLYALLGGVRLDHALAEGYGDWLPPSRRGAFTAIEAKPQTYRTAYDEFAAFSLSADESHARRWSDDLPLVVLTAGGDKAPRLPREEREHITEVWRELQSELAARSPRGEWTVVRESGHFIQSERPEVVIEAIRKVVAAARSDISRAPNSAEK